MTDNLKKQPKKGILKNSSSFESVEREKQEKGTKWDEMNIIATLHPKDKDYGHMKIEEPKTPFAYHQDAEGSGDEMDCLDASVLAEKIKVEGTGLPKAMQPKDEEEEESDSEEETLESKEKRMVFEMKRKQHYNEYYAVKLARKLMEQDDDEDEEDEDEGSKGDNIDEQEDSAEDSVDSCVETKETGETKDDSCGKKTTGNEDIV